MNPLHFRSAPIPLWLKLLAPLVGVVAIALLLSFGVLIAAVLVIVAVIGSLVFWVKQRFGRAPKAAGSTVLEGEFEVVRPTPMPRDLDAR
jgi:hypothetical protein